MRILIVSYMDPISPSGVRVYYEMLAKHLTLSGHQVNIVSPELTPFLIHKLTGLARRAFSMFGNEMRILAFQFRDFLRIYFACKKMAEPEIVHGQDVGSAVAAGMAFNWQCPIVLTCHYNDNSYIEILNQENLSDKNYLLLRWWFKFLFSRIHNFIFVSHYTQQCSLEWLPDKSKVTVIHNAVNFDFLSKIPASTEIIERCNGRKIILNVGTLETRKNQFVFIELAKKIDMQKYAICIVGDGPDMSTLRRRIHDEKLQNDVFLLGYRNDVPSLLHAASLYLHVAKNESFGLILIEAIACGTPVLAFNVGGVSEIFQGLENDSLISPRISLEDLTRRIQAYLDDEKRLTSLAFRQYENACQKFDIKQMLQKIMTFYQECMIRNLGT